MSRHALATSLTALALTGGLAVAAGPATAATTATTPAGTPAAQASLRTADVSTVDAAAVARREAYEARLLALVNRARAKGGLAPLARSRCASSFAVLQATRMASHEWMYHQYLQPIASTCRSSMAGENVAYGTISADQMFLNWMHSTPHRRNILNPSYTSMGNGARTDSGTVYSSQVFLRQR